MESSEDLEHLYEVLDGSPRISKIILLLLQHILCWQILILKKLKRINDESIIMN